MDSQTNRRDDMTRRVRHMAISQTATPERRVVTACGLEVAAYDTSVEDCGHYAQTHPLCSRCLAGGERHPYGPRAVTCMSCLGTRRYNA